MVSTALLSGIITFLGGAVTALVVAGLWIWRHTRTVDDQNIDRLNELENNQKSVFSAELADLYTDIEDCIEEANDPPDEIGRDEHVVNIIHREVSQDDLDSIVSELDRIGNSRDLYEEYEDELRECYYSCAKGASAFFLLALFVIAGALSPGSASDPVMLMLYFLTGLIGADQAHSAYSSFKQGNNRKDEFEQNWRDYKSAD